MEAAQIESLDNWSSSLGHGFWLCFIRYMQIYAENISSQGTKRVIFSERDEPLLTKINQGQLSDPKVFVSSILGLSAFTSDVLDIKV